MLRSHTSSLRASSTASLSLCPAYPPTSALQSTILTATKYYGRTRSVVSSPSMESSGQTSQQKYCVTREGMDESCQWSNVVVQLAYMVRLTRRGIRTMGEPGFGEMGDDAHVAHQRPWKSGRLKHSAPGRSIAMIFKLALDISEVED
jgi:hypothetical protein